MLCMVTAAPVSVSYIHILKNKNKYITHQINVLLINASQHETVGGDITVNQLSFTRLFFFAIFSGTDLQQRFICSLVTNKR